DVVQEAAARLGLDPSAEAPPRRKPSEPPRRESALARVRWRLWLIVTALAIAVMVATAAAYLYGEQALRVTRGWITERFSPPTPPKPEPATATKGRARP